METIKSDEEENVRGRILSNVRLNLVTLSNPRNQSSWVWKNS